MAESAPLRVLLDASYDGRRNMVIDEKLFRSCVESKTKSILLRFYHFNEVVTTVGYGMWRSAGGDRSGMIRRLTGGGIVSHDPSDLTYCLILPLNAHSKLRHVRDSYELLHETLRHTFSDCGVQTSLYRECDSCQDQKVSYCFEAPVLFDVMKGNVKIAGAGQKRSQGYLMHEGSIAWRYVQREIKVGEVEFSRRFAVRLAELCETPIIEVSPQFQEKGTLLYG